MAHPVEWDEIRAARAAAYVPDNRANELHNKATDREIKAHARWAALRVKSIVARAAELAVTAKDLAVLSLDMGASPASANSVQGIIARMADPHWWARKLRNETLRRNETAEHAAGAVRRKGQVYVTDHASKTKRERRKTNREILEGLECVSEDGEIVNMADVADASTSNPKHRRAELMLRCRGFEEVAQMFGHAAIFLTLTCPSRFHRFNAAGRDNAKWQGETPKDGQGYLCKTWAKIRAAWKRLGFMPYGFRVAEPHHDGCPHWHILIFAPFEQIGWFDPLRLIAGRKDSGAGILGIAGRYALNDGATEAGAAKHRFTVEHIDASKGSATGYIAKYISKNIDGMAEDGTAAVGLDFASGKTATDASQRVRDWAATWGIRQFQQIGGPSITVYRELRRLGEAAEPLQLDLFEVPRICANEGNWRGFYLAQGGPDVPPKALTLHPFYTDSEPGRYGDSLPRITGVLGQDQAGEYVEVTRTKTWTTQTAGAGEANAAQAEWDAALEFAKRHAGFVAAYSDLEFEFKARSAPWTSVNNCTESGKKFDFSAWENDERTDLDHLDSDKAIAASMIERYPDPLDVLSDIRWLERQQENTESAWAWRMANGKTAPGRQPGTT